MAQVSLTTAFSDYILNGQINAGCQYPAADKLEVPHNVRLKCQMYEALFVIEL